MADIKNPFEIQSMFEHYLQKAGMDPNEMPEEQLIEIKRAFYGGCSTTLIVLRDDVGSLPEEVAAVQFGNMIEQCMAYWKSQLEEQ